MLINPQMKMFLTMIKNKNNPQQMVLSMLEQMSGNNPMMKNLLSLALDGKSANIEQIAKNLLASQGLDFDKEFGEFQELLNSL